MMTLRSVGYLWMLSVLGLCLSASGSTLFTEDFESPVLTAPPHRSKAGNGIYSAGWLAPWDHKGSAGGNVLRPVVGRAWKAQVPPALGAQFGVLSSGNQYMDLNETYQANTLYTLTFTQFRRDNLKGAGVHARLMTTADDRVADVVFDAVAEKDRYVTRTVTFQTGDEDGCTGQTIRIQLSGLGARGKQVAIDNIELQAVPAPAASEPLVKPAVKTSIAPSGMKRPNIVYVLTDQWRAQAIGYAGDPNVKTPHLDGLASEGVNFVNAVSIVPSCTPHRAALLTGRYPLSTGMFVNDLALPSEELCMAEMFTEAGYDTGYIGKWHLDGRGRDAYIPRERRQGFDYWKVLECTHNYNNSFYYAGDDPTKRKWDGYDAYAQTKDAQAYIRDRAKNGKPFLLVMSYGGPHFPHHSAPADLKALYPIDSIKLRPNVPDSKRERSQKEAQGYYAHCTALDRCVGDLRQTLEESGISDHTIFVFTSDHGEMLGSQGVRPFEKQRPWDESILVPFLLSYPQITGKTGREVATPINTPDILPTLLALSGIKIPKTIEGEDLSRLIKDRDLNEDRAALVMSVAPFAGYSGGKAFRGIRTSQYTYVRSVDGPWLMYDNEQDPYQMNNLIESGDRPELQQELDQKLQAKLKETGDAFLGPKESLKAWGYHFGKKHAIPYGRNAPVQGPAVKPE